MFNALEGPKHQNKVHRADYDLQICAKESQCHCYTRFPSAPPAKLTYLSSNRNGNGESAQLINQMGMHNQIRSN